MCFSRDVLSEIMGLLAERETGAVCLLLPSAVTLCHCDKSVQSQNNTFESHDARMCL